MQRLEVVTRDWKPDISEGVRFQYAADPPPDALIITDDVVLLDETGDTVGAVVNVPEARAGVLFRHFAGVAWADTKQTSSQSRLSGIRNANRTFGAMQPVPLRRRPGCSRCTFNADHPAALHALEDVARLLWRAFDAAAPEAAAAHQTLVRKKIHRDWWFGGTPWTSGIINQTAALPYHRDAGNLKGAWSAQLTVRRNVVGGLLHLPEYGVYLDCSHRQAMVFRGQSAWHGVTPISVTAPRAARYSIVFYAKSGIQACGPAADEARRAALARTAREDARA